MPVSKRTRFEVLRRDGFKCHYCRTTEGELHVDHVLPVALGGTDTPDNLVAACLDCNSGKGSTGPGEETVAAVSETHARWAKAMQDAAQIVESKLDDSDSLIVAFEEHWPQYRAKSLPADYDRSIMALHRAGLTEPLMLDAITAALSAPNVSRRFAYFCGVAWRHVRELQAVAQQLMEDD